MHDVDPVLTDFKATMEKVDAQMAKFEELCQNEKSVRKTIFYRVKHALSHVERQKLHIQQLLRRFVDALLQMVSSRNLSNLEDPAASDWHFAFETTDAFNKVILLLSFTGLPINKEHILTISNSNISLKPIFY